MKTETEGRSNTAPDCDDTPTTRGRSHLLENNNKVLDKFLQRSDLESEVAQILLEEKWTTLLKGLVDFANASVFENFALGLHMDDQPGGFHLD